MIILDYKEWLENIVYPDWSDRMQHQRLLSDLFETTYYPRMRSDVNRQKDGLELRYRYSYEKEIRVDEVRGVLPERCSLLEMLVAMAIRCEEEITGDLSKGDRTSYWLRCWIHNLGIDMSDAEYNERTYKSRVTTFLLRRYAYDGEGSIFYIPNPPEDMRYVDTWLALSYWLETQDV